MRVIKGTHNGGHDSNMVVQDENGKIIAVFEDKSSVLGSKIAVYNGDGEQSYFLDEKMDGEYISFDVLKGFDTPANVRRMDNLPLKPVKIDSKEGKYNFSQLNRVLHKDGDNVLKLVSMDIGEGFEVELYTEDDDEFNIVLAYTIYTVKKRKIRR